MSVFFVKLRMLINNNVMPFTKIGENGARIGN